VCVSVGRGVSDGRGVDVESRVSVGIGGGVVAGDEQEARMIMQKMERMMRFC
jgi:hypothetical protein